MNDPIFHSFLEAQYEQATALAGASDILTLEIGDERPPQRYVAHFNCRGLVMSQSGEVEEANYFMIGIRLPDDYLRTVDPTQIVTTLRPWSIWHPNARGPFICPGKLTMGTSLVDLLFQIYEIITYQKWSAHDGLNAAACEWARNNQHRFPVDRRPLKWKEARP